MNFEEPVGEDIRGDDLVGRYSNFFKVGHSAFEFVIDFGQSYTENQAGRFHTRIVTSPFYAKVLLNLLHDSINQHEYKFGSIPRNGTK